MAKEYVAICVRNGEVFDVRPASPQTEAILNRKEKTGKHIGEMVAAFAGHQYELLPGNGIIALGEVDLGRSNFIVFMQREV